MVNVDLASAHNRVVARIRDAMVEVAGDWDGTPYLFGGNSDQGIDCSHFVYQVLNGARGRVASTGEFPSTQLVNYQSTSTIESSGQFFPVTIPEVGDLVLWDGHVGIVSDPKSGKFVGAQTSTGVAEASYTAGYWATRAGKRFARYYWFF